MIHVHDFKTMQNICLKKAEFKINDPGKKYDQINNF